MHIKIRGFRTVYLGNSSKLHTVTVED